MQLYLNTYGTYLHIKDQLFEVRVPQKDEQGKTIYEKKHFAASKVTSIILTTSISLSTDAVKLALVNNIDILFVESDGHPLGRIWHCKLGSTTRIRKCQLETSLNTAGLQYTKQWISLKLGNQIQFIRDLKKHRSGLTDYLDERSTRIEQLLVSVQALQGNTVSEIADTLRGLEGTAGRLYFEVISYVLPDGYRFAGRSSRPAQDGFNAFLNYGYGILYSRVEKTLIIAGLDPYVGFLHRDDYNQKSMVYDFIEPYRIQVERVVFRLFSAKKVNKLHTDAITNGFTLNKEGKILLVTALNEYTEEEKVQYKGRNQTRSNAMQQDAHTFANALIEKSTD